MKVDSYIEMLLRKWGRCWMSEYLGYPRKSPMFSEYIPKGYREEKPDADMPQVERLAEFISDNILDIRYQVLRIRYRVGERNVRKAAKQLGISEHVYNELFKSAIESIYRGFLNKRPV